jgi:hypothetical protein
VAADDLRESSREVISDAPILPCVLPPVTVLTAALTLTCYPLPPSYSPATTQLRVSEAHAHMLLTASPSPKT